MAKVDLRAVTEDFVLPEQPTSEDRVKAYYAQGRRDARAAAKREHDTATAQRTAEHQAHIAGIKSAQTDELDRQAKLIGKGAHRDGVLQGVFLGMLIAVGIGCLAMVGYNQVMAMRVAIGRVPQASVPAITDTYADPAYERGAREPGTAGN